jgi:hypothetical protein
MDRGIISVRKNKEENVSGKLSLNEISTEYLLQAALCGTHLRLVT